MVENTQQKRSLVAEEGRSSRADDEAAALVVSNHDSNLAPLHPAQQLNCGFPAPRLPMLPNNTEERRGENLG